MAASCRAALKPDAILNVQRTVVNMSGPSTYTFTVRDVSAKRDLWKGSIVAGGGIGAENILAAGTQTAVAVVRALSADGVVPSCPALPGGDA